MASLSDLHIINFDILFASGNRVALRLVLDNINVSDFVFSLTHTTPHTHICLACFLVCTDTQLLAATSVNLMEVRKNLNN